MTFMVKTHWQIRGGGELETRALLFVQFLSFSCSFRQKTCQMIGFRPQLKGWRLLGNPEALHWSNPYFSMCGMNTSKALHITRFKRLKVPYFIHKVGQGCNGVFPKWNTNSVNSSNRINH